jgi:cytoskeleton protein RodZ
MRERIDVSEIEAKTKIRAKYLRALENEEWGLLPGPTFVKSFLRTYAQALGLDGKALVEEYRLHHERPIGSTPQSNRRSQLRRRGRGGSSEGASRGYMIAVGVITLVIVVLLVALLSGGGGSGSPTTGTSTVAATHRHSSTSHHTGASAGVNHASSQFVALSLKPSAVVYVCLLGDDGRTLIPGIELQPGETTRTYHAKRFQITLGNSSVTMVVDGIPRTVAPSSQAIGYSITKATGRRPLAAGQLPTCT